MRKIDNISGDRRQFLTATAIGSAALALPAMALAGPSTEWDAKKAIHDGLKAKYRAFMDAHYMPHLERWKINREYRIPFHIEVECDRLGEPVSDLEDRLMEMPAPHRSALRWKLHTLLASEGDGSPGWSEEYVRQTVADYRRLLGDA